MELEAVAVGIGEFVVQDLETGQHLTYILDESQARLLAEAERALALCEELATLDNDAGPDTLVGRARHVVRRARVGDSQTSTALVWPLNPQVTIIGGDDEAA